MELPKSNGLSAGPAQTRAPGALRRPPSSTRLGAGCDGGDRSAPRENRGVFLAKARFTTLRRSLLRWYDRNKRDLPWRRTRDPYALWIAETMLQQTQIRTVLPYYRSFLKAFPSLRALERAPLEKVLALWAGLGYYRRAENLKRAARVIARDFGGTMPRAFETLRALPGVGDYTAGALASIAFGQRYPALDGNARRVLQRLFQTRTSAELNELAKRFVPQARPGDFNQALMDLGAQICLPRDPKCNACPWRRPCAARRSGRYELRRRPPANSEAVIWPLLVILDSGKILLRRRAGGGLLAGLWEVPGGRKLPGEKARETLRRELGSMGRFFGKLRPAGEVRHSITRYRIRAPVFVSAAWRPRLNGGTGWRWVPLASLGRYPLSSLSMKAARLASRTQRAVDPV
ncbi:MAG TPA: A/G-specific adenine glycosylase [Candidatus Acidoferrales bacterium]|nr:A/G-specific adenine glycosylase [Candidatus Acidoferrales bacterium]